MPKKKETKVAEPVELATLEEIKQKFLKKGKKEDSISQSDILDATKHLDLSPDDLEDLIDFFEQEGIIVASEEEGVDDFSDDDFSV